MKILSNVLTGIAVCIIGLFVVPYAFQFVHAGTTYYVATDGNDANPGTIDQPFATIDAGVNALTSGAGDTLYVRGGTYTYEAGTNVFIDDYANGTEGNHTVIAGYPGERPVIDGQFQAPTEWNGLVYIKGSYITFRNFEIKNSISRGIQVWKISHNSQNVIIDDVHIHHTVRAAIFSEYVNNLTITNSKFWFNCLVNDESNEFGDFYIHDNWPGALTTRRADNITIKGNEIFQSYGEGMNIHGGATNVLIEDNTVYDTWAPAIYPINSHNVLVQRNLVYHTNDSRFLRNDNPNGGILTGNEYYHMDEHQMIIQDIDIINNVVVGFEKNFGFVWSTGTGADWLNNSGMINVNVLHNTFVNAHANTPRPSSTSVFIQSGNHSNSRFENNIIQQSNSSATVAYASTSNISEITFRNNLWSQKPYFKNINGDVMYQEHLESASDVIGDAQIATTGTLSPGQLTANYFKLLSNSPAIDAGTNAGIASDIFGKNRDSSPDIGAYEKEQPSSNNNGDDENNQDNPDNDDTNTTDNTVVSESAPVYRFWSDQKQGHFYTANIQERDHVISSYDDFVWRYEGIAYRAYATQMQGTIPVYRFWSDQKQGHFYTASAEEKDHVINTYDDFVWRYEGIAYYVYPLTYTSSVKTVYRFWSDQKQKHFYTASAQERDHVINTYDDFVWRYEGTAWNVPQ